MTRKLNVGYFIHIFVTHAFLPFPSPLRLWTPYFPTLTCVTTNSEFNYILALQITHFQTWPSVSKWKLQVSMEKCLTASQHKTLHPNSKHIFSFTTKCTRTIECLYWLLNVCYMFRRSLRHSLITSQNHLLIVRLLQLLSYRAWSVIYVGLFTKLVILIKNIYS
jgi:hypothetical protein